MTTNEKIVLFYDILDTTSPAFKLTSERPISDIVLNYINEAQIQILNARYLPGDFVTNIDTIKRLQAELGELLEEEEVKTLGRSTKYNISYKLGVDWTKYISLVESSLKMDREVLLEGKNLITNLTPITHTSINRYLTNHTNAPIILEPVVFMEKEGEDLVILVDRFTTPLSATVTWLKKPKELMVGGEGSQLHEKFHEQLVRTAVELFIQDKVKLAPKERQGNDSSRDAS